MRRHLSTSGHLGGTAFGCKQKSIKQSNKIWYPINSIPNETILVWSMIPNNTYTSHYQQSLDRSLYKECSLLAALLIPAEGQNMSNIQSFGVHAKHKSRAGCESTILTARLPVWMCWAGKNHQKQNFENMSISYNFDQFWNSHLGFCEKAAIFKTYLPQGPYLLFSSSFNMASASHFLNILTFLME